MEDEFLSAQNKAVQDILNKAKTVDNANKTDNERTDSTIAIQLPKKLTPSDDIEDVKRVVNHIIDILSRY